METSKLLDELLKQIEDITKKAEELKVKVDFLERKNEQLSTYLRGDEKLQSTSNLIKLYEQGFHICHESFGKLRSDDCLFCLNILARTNS